MELTALRYFAAVAKELHFRKAAAKLHITQAPLSAAIRKLEDELSCKLFERTSRMVKLTAAGEFFLAEAEAVLNRADQAQKQLADFLAGEKEQLLIGCNEPAIHSFLPEVLSRVRNQEPEIRMQLRELETAEQCVMLKNGSLDIGFLRPSSMDISGLTTRLIYRDRYILVLPRDHKLARCGRISREDLAGEDVILFARDVNPAIYDQLVYSLTVHGLPSPRFRQDARNKSSMLAMVQAGFGIALMPESCCKGPLENIVRKELSPPLPPVDIIAAWRSDNDSRAVKKFIRFLPGSPEI
ncbi:MAG: LysR family transcriptional regulator [Lentisphaerae bacterium]|nr:LysR family transcriptional regulator [Lentisphaerota bacterium]